MLCTSLYVCLHIYLAFVTQIPALILLKAILANIVRVVVLCSGHLGSHHLNIKINVGMLFQGDNLLCVVNAIKLPMAGMYIEHSQ